MNRKEQHIFGLEGILRQLIAFNVPFLVYQMPQAEDFHLWIGGKVSLFSPEKLKKGFLIAPFDDENKSYLYHDAFCFSSSMVNFLDEAKRAAFNSSPFSVSLTCGELYDDFQSYKSAFEKIKQKIEAKEVKKVVLSRRSFVKSLTISSAIPMLSERLMRAEGFVYFFSLPQCGMWLGTTPELLLSKQNDCLKTVSLAASLAKNGDSVWREKEKEEQQIVTQYIEQVFKNSNLIDIQISDCETIEIRGIKHLKTSFFAKKTEKTPSLFSLISQLSPTPAVCGYPKEISKQIIRFVEQSDRKFYAGFLGLIDEEENCEFYVNLRCVEFLHDGANVYVGGGITEQSTLEEEWKETELKLHSILCFLTNRS
ncbi:MAG: chorismate-binding protein [Paludibacteraceae bacterium]|nr:chorismate-binding protein [Paludibacteraceae bacterium]